MTNSGSIGAGLGWGVYNDGAGVIAAFDNSGTITAKAIGLLNNGIITSLTNSGTINGVLATAGIHNNGTITALTNSGTIGGGVYTGGSLGTLTNSLTISGAKWGIQNAGTMQTLTNNGGATITGGNGQWGLYNSGTIVKGVQNNGFLIGGHTGIYNSGSIGTLVNNGSILSSGGSTIAGSFQGIVNVGSIGGFSNNNYLSSAWNNGGKIIGSSAGVQNTSTIAALTNDGTISGNFTGLSNSGNIPVLSNSKFIYGGTNGINNTGTIGSLSNTGTIQGGAYAIESQFGSFGALTNSGAIIGNMRVAFPSALGGQAYLSITGGANNVLGTLTGPLLVNGTVTSATSGSILVNYGNLTFASGNVLLADDITVNNGTGTVYNFANLTLNTRQTIYGQYAQGAYVNTSTGSIVSTGTINGAVPAGTTWVAGTMVIGAGQGTLVVVPNGSSTSTITQSSGGSSPPPTPPPDPPVVVLANRGDNSPTGTVVLIDSATPQDYPGFTTSGVGYSATMRTQVTGDGHYQLVADLVRTDFILDTDMKLLLFGLSGTRNLLQTGSGSTTLIGTNDYTGTTSVTNGALNIFGLNTSPSYSVTGGVLRAEGTLTGTVTVSSGGQLVGSGSFGGGTIGAGGIIAPGGLMNSLFAAGLGSNLFAAGLGSRFDGSLTSNGNLTFAAGSLYKIGVNAAGDSDKILVNGRATLQGGTVQVQAAAGTYNRKTNYTILTASNGVTGGFAGVTSDLAFLSPSLSYDVNDVFLTMRRNDVNYAAVAQTQNEYSVATSLQRAYFKPLAEGGGKILDAVNTLTVPQARALLNAVSGEGISAAQTAAYGAVNLFVEAARGQAAYWLMGEPVNMNPVNGSNLAAGADLASAANPWGRGWRTWATALGETSSFNGVANIGSASASVRNGGGSAGLDYEVNPDLLLGMTAGGTSSSYSVSQRSTSGLLTAGNLGFYGVTKWDAFYASGLLSYGRFGGQSTRWLSGMGGTESEKGDLGTDAYTGRLELGYRGTDTRINLTPFVALQATSLQQGGFTETSTRAGGQPGMLGLTVQSRSGVSEPMSIGMQFDRAFQVTDDWTVTPVLRLAWVHDFQPNRSVAAGLTGLPGNAWTVMGASGAEDAINVGISVQGMNRDGLAFFAVLDALPSSRTNSYQGQVGVKFIW